MYKVEVTSFQLEEDQYKNMRECKRVTVYEQVFDELDVQALATVLNSRAENIKLEVK